MNLKNHETPIHPSKLPLPMAQVPKHLNLLAATTTSALLILHRVTPSCMSTGNGIIIGCSWYLARQFLESLAFGLWYQGSCEYAAQHEQGKNLHDMVKPRGSIFSGRAACAKGPEDGLSNNSADFARSGRETVRGAAVTSGEAFTGHDKSSCIGAYRPC